MRKDKIKAYELRRAGHSYKKIRSLLNIPISTLSDWFGAQDWSKEIMADLGSKQSFASPQKLAAIQKANKDRWSKLHKSYREAGEKDFEGLKDNSLFLACLMLYWAQGDKDPKISRVKLSNTDPSMIRLFYFFLKDVLKIPKEKICIWLLLYPDLADEMQKNFWSRATGIPLHHFKKSIYLKGNHPTKRHSYGVGNIYVHSRELKEKIITWINLYQKVLLK